ncbi:hypothetical protein ATANTOWER_031742 [Ataeniobius toweri]|uniref:Uncharacterized protein n=1 Tax=Ataeniobius toweri TaxID=208326 RepID=A0ABU7BPL5_9TELE|nr:hypothetical protein [Ataeniobius toweri]
MAKSESRAKSDRHVGSPCMGCEQERCPVYRTLLAEMLILLVTLFSAFCGASAGLLQEKACYGSEVKLPDNINPPLNKGLLYFTPSNGGERKILMEDGKAKDPRLKVSHISVRLTDLTKKDEGVYAVLLNGKDFLDVLQLKVLDCAQKISRFSMQDLEYTISEKAQYLEYSAPDNQNVTLTLWNRTDTLNNDDRRGNVERNVWRISRVTQADNGYYNFRRRDRSLDSRILLTVNENTYYYDPKVNGRLLITNPWTGGPWTVMFKQDTEDEKMRVMKDGRLYRDYNQFTGRIDVLNNGIEIDPVKTLDSGTFEFRDKQGNLALSAKGEIIQASHHATAYMVVGAVALVLGICCCYCCCCRKSCCKEDRSAAGATEGPAVTYHDQSDPTAPGPVVYFHETNEPTGPSYSNQPYPSVYPPQPVNSPAFTEPTAVAIEPPPSQPNTTVYPPQATNVNPPQPEFSLYPALSEIGPSTSQGSAAAPTFSSEVFSSDAEPRFQLKGVAFPSAPPLSSDAPTSAVYYSDKLNFLGTAC